MSIEKEDNFQPDSPETVWDEMSTYRLKHPFLGNDGQDIQMEEGPKPELTLPLDVVRKIHVDYLAGTYIPSREEWHLIFKDDSFYSSKEYLQFRENEIDDVSRKNAEIYAPSDELIQRNIQPYVESIREDCAILYDIGCSMEKGGVTEDNVSRLAEFFAEKFEVTILPKISLVKETDDGCNGYYIDSKNEMVIRIDKTRSVAQIIGTISHEMWHVHQYKSEKTEYGINFDYYYESSMDYDKYCNQLVEKEAFALGDSISDIYRRLDLEKHPERIPDLRRKYKEWIGERYCPDETEDGLDYKYLIMANEFKIINKWLRPIIDFFERRKNGKK